MRSDSQLLVLGAGSVSSSGPCGTRFGVDMKRCWRTSGRGGAIVRATLVGAPLAALRSRVASLSSGGGVVVFCARDSGPSPLSITGGSPATPRELRYGKSPRILGSLGVHFALDLVALCVLLLVKVYGVAPEWLECAV